MKQILLLSFLFFISLGLVAQQDTIINKKDLKKDVSIETSMGTMIVRLSDATPLHRDNFLKLVKVNYYDSLLFHRVIKDFMIQGGDPDSKLAKAGQALGSGGPGHRVPAEFSPALFHKKGVIAAARDSNPNKSSSGSQFYITQGKIHTDSSLDVVERTRLEGRKIPAEFRTVYKTRGGTPQLDQNYTVFGEVVKGLDVIDKIAGVPTSRGVDRDRPLGDVRIINMKLVKRKKYRKGN